MIENREVSKESIARRAYELYAQRGCEAGKDVEDWVIAEKELRAEPSITPGKTRAASPGQFS